MKALLILLIAVGPAITVFSQNHEDLTEFASQTMFVNYEDKTLYLKTQELKVLTSMILQSYGVVRSGDIGPNSPVLPTMVEVLIMRLAEMSQWEKVRIVAGVPEFYMSKTEQGDWHELMDRFISEDLTTGERADLLARQMLRSLGHDNI